jgi:triosephosphate isomerase
MRKKLVVGNWKMNLTQAEAVSAVESLIKKVCLQDTVEVGICPPYLSIGKVREVVRRTAVAVGAQDVFWVDSGAFTGRVSAPMLADAGVRMCIVGHSETRGRFGKLDVPESTVPYFAETDETVNLKLKALLYHNIVPILCVGETLSEREAGNTDSVIRTQMEGAFLGVEAAEFGTGVVAYEPVWAIGTGKTCDSAEASRVCGVIRQVLASLFGKDTAESIRILYGGSVKSSNSAELFHKDDIDGGLVGGASLDPEEFCRIVMSGA